jgi:hypothetical protein
MIRHWRMARGVSAWKWRREGKDFVADRYMEMPVEPSLLWFRVVLTAINHSINFLWYHFNNNEIDEAACFRLHCEVMKRLLLLPFNSRTGAWLMFTLLFHLQYLQIPFSPLSFGFCTSHFEEKREFRGNELCRKHEQQRSWCCEFMKPIIRSLAE